METLDINWQKTFTEVFNLIPGISFWMKDESGKFTMANQNFIDMAGAGSVQSLIGKSDHEIWQPHLAQGYVNDDKMVMVSRKPINNRIELIREAKGVTTWYSTSKFPLVGRSGTIMGVGGFSINMKKNDANFTEVMKMAPAIDYIMDNYAGNIEMNYLARLMGLSLSAFERKFKKHFNVTPLKYLNRIRLEAASELLVSTDDTLTEISRKTGFYDQSHFSKQFHKFSGSYPSQYRKRYQK